MTSMSGSDGNDLLFTHLKDHDINFSFIILFSELERINLTQPPPNFLHNVIHFSVFSCEATLDNIQKCNLLTNSHSISGISNTPHLNILYQHRRQKNE